MNVLAYHIEQGPTEMFPVDATQAVTKHPLEWSRVPWTEEAKAAAMPQLKQKRQKAIEDNEQQRRDASGLLGTYDQTGAKVVSPIAPQTQQAPAGLQAGSQAAHTPPYAEADQKAAAIRALEEDAARAQNDLDNAKADQKKARSDEDKATSDKRVGEAQKAYDDARSKLDDAKK